MTKIYFDTCCLNRPFDDQTQTRIHLEAEAVLAILGQIENAKWDWVGSDVLEDEVEQIPDTQKLSRISLLLDFIEENVRIGESEVERARDLQKKGFQLFDALHIACAESAKVDVFLSTDDRLLKLAKRLSNDLQIRVENPLVWVTENI